MNAEHVATPPLSTERSHATRGVLDRIEVAVGALTEYAAAVLVLAEIVVLFWGIVARYVFNSPLVWSDEVAGMCFLWLSMLGAVVALRRGEHMRMTALVARLGPSARASMDCIAMTAALAFLVLVAYPAYQYTSDQAIVTTPALQISDAWRASALPVGIGLMLLVSVLRLARVCRVRDIVVSLVAVGAIIAAFWALGPLLAPLGKLNLLIFFVGVVGASVFGGIPIAFAFALATFGFLALTTTTPMSVLVGRMDEGMSHLILLAIPLFVFLGLLIEMTGMASAMVRFLASVLGRVRGGMSYVLVCAMYLVSGISGSKAADMAAIAPVLFPEMKARGTEPGELVALLSTAGAQTETIPPSIVLITVGSVTGVSISALFTAGVLPGLLLGLVLCAVIWWRYRGSDHGDAAPVARKEIGRAFVFALPSLVLPFLIRAAVVEGVATATEVSTIGIAWSVLVGLLIYRKFDARRLPAMLIETAALSGAIVFIIGSATAMAWALTQSGFAQDIAHAASSLPGGKAAFMACSVIAFMVLGSVLEGIPAIVLFGPLMFPIARAVGVNEIYYAIVVVLSMGVGLFSPPFGVGYYTACAISRVDPAEGLRHIWGYLAALIAGLVLITAVPWISTCLLH